MRPPTNPPNHRAPWQDSFVSVRVQPAYAPELFFVFDQAQAALAEPARDCYVTVMIDQGFCFNAGAWNYPDAPLRGLYAADFVQHALGDAPAKSCRFVTAQSCSSGRKS